MTVPVYPDKQKPTITLAHAFDQIEIEVGDAQAFLTTIITNIRDRYPELHASIMDQISQITS
jgi:hypothetical protein